MVEIIYPLGKDKNVWINPNIQWGLPVVKGTRIPTRAIMSLYKSGESINFIARLHNIAPKKVKSAIKYENLPIGRRHKYEYAG